MRYLWTEDTGAGLHFWKLVNQLFFDNELAVESKGSNQGLLDAVLDLRILKRIINTILHLIMWLIIRTFTTSIVC